MNEIDLYPMENDRSIFVSFPLQNNFRIPCRLSYLVLKQSLFKTKDVRAGGAFPSRRRRRRCGQAAGGGAACRFFCGAAPHVGACGAGAAEAQCSDFGACGAGGRRRRLDAAGVFGALDAADAFGAFNAAGATTGAAAAGGCEAEGEHVEAEQEAAEGGGGGDHICLDKGRRILLHDAAFGGAGRRIFLHETALEPGVVPDDFSYWD